MESNFNEQQLKAINSNSPTILAIAGPGAGKSATLVARVQRLIRDGTDPAAICVITFTNAAARELQERCAQTTDCKGTTGHAYAGGKEIEFQVQSMTFHPEFGHCGTLHSFCFKLLQQHGHLIGLPQQLTILDAETAEELMAECAATLKAKGSQEKIEGLRTTYFSWAPMCKSWDVDRLAVKEYYSRLRYSGAVDFDGILHLGLQVIRAITSTDGFVGWPFKFLFADEVQDSADLDWDIYEVMPCPNKFFVGDGDQQIYSFRNPDGIGSKRFLNFTSSMTPEIVKLELNYRSRHEICMAANRLIGHNANRVPKSIVSTLDGGHVSERCFDLPDQELEYITSLIREVYPDTAAGTAREAAVLWRTNALADRCTQYLKGHGIAVVERRRVQPAATATARAALAVMMNPYNEMAVLRYITLIDSKAAATKANRDAIIRMENVAHAYFKGALDVLVTPDKGEHILSEITGIFSDQIKVPSEARDCLRSAAAKIGDRFTLADLMFALDEQPEADTGNGVTVCTCHAAKGREFDFVVIGGCEQETWLRKGDDEAEARRLFFVAVTRARNRLVLTTAAKRPAPFRDWIMEDKTVSQFVTECFKK